MDRSTVKITLRKRELETLRDVCLWYWENRDDFDTAHMKLLHEENVRIYRKLKKKLETIDTEGQLKLDGAEALAFCQLYGSFNQQASPYAYTIIKKVTAAIDQFRKSPIPITL